MKKFNIREIDERPFESVEWEEYGESPDDIWDRFFRDEELTLTGVFNDGSYVKTRTVIRDGAYVEIYICEIEEED